MTGCNEAALRDVLTLGMCDLRWKPSAPIPFVSPHHAGLASQLQAVGKRGRAHFLQRHVGIIKFFQPQREKLLAKTWAFGQPLRSKQPSIIRSQLPELRTSNPQMKSHQTSLNSSENWEENSQVVSVLSQLWYYIVRLWSPATDFGTWFCADWLWIWTLVKEMAIGDVSRETPDFSWWNWLLADGNQKN